MINHIRLTLSTAAAGLLLCLASGCKQNSAAPAALPISQAPQAIEMAFKDAKPELKKKADEAVAALNEKKMDRALVLLQELSVKSGLTARQREAAAGSMLAANQEVQAAAAKGDAQADALVQYRRMSK